MYGAGFVSLEYLTERMPADVFNAWAIYVVEYDRLAARREEQAKHDALMDAAANAIRPKM